MLKIKSVSLILVMCVMLTAIMPLTFAEEAPIKLENLQVGKSQIVYLCPAKANEKCEVVNGELPGGMTVKHEDATENEDAFWSLEGTPDAAGTYEFSIKLSDDSTSETVTRVYAVSVYDRILEEGTVCSTYASGIVSDNSKLFVCSVVSGALPEDFFLAGPESDLEYGSSSWSLMSIYCKKSGEYTFDIEIKTVGYVSGEFPGESSEIIKCYLKINELTMPNPEDCSVFETFENELSGWKCNGFERVESENAYEGKYVIKANSEATLTMPIFKAGYSSVLMFYVKLPENETLEVKMLRSAEESRLTDGDGIEEHSTKIEGTGEWTASTVNLTNSYYLTEFSYNGNSEIMIDLVAVTLGYDEHHTLEKAYEGFEYYCEFDGWVFARNEYRICGNLPDGFKITELERDIDDSNHRFAISGISHESHSFGFDIRYYNNDGTIRYIEQYTVPVFTPMTGDLTGDIMVTTADAVVLLKYSCGIKELSPVQAAMADTNFDDKINTADAVLILKYAAGMIQEF